MAASSWTMACLWLALGQTPSDVLVTNQRGLSIPVNIQESRRAELRELVLYASNDQGRSWQQVAAMPPTQNAFTFNAPIDGSYWLRVAVINRQGKQEPENLFQGAPDQKVVIDTMKPLLRMKSPDRQGDEVTVAWELQEDNPEWSTFRLEYQVKDSGPIWTPIQAVAGLTGQARFRAPSAAGRITVRLSFKDQAGNQAVTQADLGGAIATVAYTAPQTPPPNPLPQAPLNPLPPAPANTLSQVQANGLPPAPMFPGVSATPLPPLPGVETPKLPPVEAPKTFPMNSPPAAMTAPWSAATPKSEPGKIVASSQFAPPPPPGPSPIQAVAPQRTLQPLHYVNHTDVTLEYELDHVGPSGIGSIELWWTQNDGQSWELYAIDPESKSGTVSNGRHKRTIEMPGDGVFGFVLVVKSKAGLGKAPPRAGDLPEIRIEVDTAAPEADLYAPQPDSQKANTLLLRWMARDANLANTPIILEWSSKREGPWQQIAAPLPNSGKHSWQLPDGLPVQVYLRLRVRDQAGNERIIVTPDPQLVDLSEPVGRLVNVSVSPR